MRNPAAYLLITTLSLVPRWSAAQAEDSPNIAKAEALFERARYERALKVLGPTCERATEPASCERIRGFVLVALGREKKARAAFERMLLLDPGATLGRDVSPSYGVSSTALNVLWKP